MKADKRTFLSLDIPTFIGTTSAFAENEIIKFIDFISNGTFLCVMYKTDYGKGITKVTSTVLRLGCDYKNLKGSPEKPKPIAPCYTRDAERPLKVFIKPDGSKQIRFTRTKTKSTSRYLYNGKEITKEEAMLINPNKFRFNTNPPPVINIKFENILSMSFKNYELGGI